MTTADRLVRSLEPARYPPEPSSVAFARRRLLDFLGGDVPDEASATAALLVSELATNVVRHAGTPFALRVDVAPFRLRVEVADNCPEPPVVKAPVPGEEGGRGMSIVSHFADNWGIEAIPDGKRVWFELSLGAEAE